MWSFIKRHRRAIRWALAIVVVGVLGSLWRSAIRRNRGIPDTPFRVAANLYYVGGAGVTSFLLTGPEGHVLIDGGYPELAAGIEASIAELGFDLRDVKVLLNTHAHADHAGGLAALQAASGAELWVSEGDAAVMAAGGAHDPTIPPQRWLPFLDRFPAPRIDHRFRDGDTIRVGPIALTAHVTGGHTPGCTSWSFPIRDGSRELLAVDVCSLTLLPFIKLTAPETYPGIRADFEHSFRALRALPADLFLASHSSWFDLKRKAAERAEAAGADGGDPAASADLAAPFIDRDGYLRYLDRSEAAFRATLAKQGVSP